MYLPPSSRRQAFTVVELLVVVAVMLMVSALAVPALRGRMESLHLSGAAEIAAGELATARQLAITRNTPVEVRFHQEEGSAYRSVSVVIPREISGKAQDEWLVAGRRFPGEIVVADPSLGNAPEHTTLLAHASPKGGGALDGAPWSGQEPATGVSTKLRRQAYFSFLFRPDGSTNLPADQPWCVSLKNRFSPVGGSEPAAHYVTLVLDPRTGRARVHQP